MVLIVKVVDVELAKKVFKLAWPALIEYFLTSLYTLVDTYFVSKLGVEDVAALGGAGYVAWAFWIPGFTFVTGVTILVAQGLGAGKKDFARRVFGEALILTFTIGSAVSLAGMLFAKDIVEAVVVNPKVTAKGTEYLLARLIGLPGMYIVFTINSALRGAKDTKTPMKTGILGNVFNMLLDPILIFGLFGAPKLGIFGAGIASTLSFYIILGIYLVLGFKEKLTITPKISLPSWEIVSKIFKLGVPVAFQRAMFSLLNLTYVSIIARFGYVALAAHQIGLRIESLAFMPAMAFRIATSALVGHEVGARKILKAKETAEAGIRLSLIFLTVVGLTLALISPYVPKLFVSNIEVAFLAMIYLILAGLSEPGLSFAMTVSGVFEGSGNTVVPTVVNILSMISARIVLGYLLGAFMNLGAIGAWIGMFVDVYLRGTVLYTLYKLKYERLIKVWV